VFGGTGPVRAVPAGQDAAPTLEGCRVLAVEDNRVNQEVIRGILRRAGCVVTLAENGALALERLAAESFDVVLMDCEMPVMDGLTATRALRAREAQVPTGEAAAGPPRQPVIALTAHALPAERERCLAAGVDDYLTKPVRANDLVEAIGRARRQRETPAWVSEQEQAVPQRGVATDGGAGDRGGPGAELDLRVLEGLREALGEIAPVIEAAVAELPERLTQLEEAAAAGDCETLRKVSHTLAGSLGNLGARQAVRLARALEKEASAGQADPGLADEVVAAVRRARRALVEVLESEKGPLAN